MNQEQTTNQNKVLTIPNLLSVLRICMIPIFAWMYRSKQDYWAAALVLLLSGLTDVADGYIARHFHMVSNLGKIIDPVADKLTQAVTLFCLIFQFPAMLFPLILLAVKEISTGVASLVLIKRTGTVKGAEWHGKVTTCLLYAMMLLHLLWPGIPSAASMCSIIACMAMMLVSYLFYGLRILRELSDQRENTTINQSTGEDPSER